MATPIIKIKRGNGIPTIAGITYGEFAYDRLAGILYLGISGGGYTTNAPYGSNNITTPINIPIGMQISNDPEFGGLAAPPTLNDVVGYSVNTVPTTYAVREFIAAAVVKGQSGITLNPGVGIGFSYADISDPTRGITINNTGVLTGFTAFGLSGNFVGNSRIFAQSAVDGLTFTVGSGLQITGNNANRTLTLLNTGVTSIGGVTGPITTFAPFVLSGFTVAVGYAENDNLTGLAPIDVVKSGHIAQVQHLPSGVVSGSYLTRSGNRLYGTDLQINTTGHIQSAIRNEIAFGDGLIPTGLTEAVQDIIFNSINTIHGLGITYYDNTTNTATLFNTGIRSLGVFGSSPAGLCGEVLLRSGSGVNVAYGPGDPPGYITFNLNPTVAGQFQNVSAGRASDIGSGGIYSGGFTGPGTQTVAADLLGDTLKMYAGRGIGISAGELGVGNDTLMIWNSGLNTITFKDNADATVGDASGYSGDFVLTAGSNISFSPLSGNRISISSSGGGSGTGTLVGDYLVENGTDLQDEYGGSGVTGVIDIIGQNGILTRQTQNTNNGDITIGLSSRLILPAQSFIGYDGDPVSGDNPGNNPAVIRIPTTIETEEQVDTFGGVIPSIVPFNPLGYSNTGLDSPEGSWNRLETDAIISGLTANVTFPTGNGPYSLGDLGGLPGTPGASKETVPGKILRLVAPSGYWKDAGSGVATYGPQAEIRLMGFPSAEHLGSELQRLQVENTQGSNSTEPGYEFVPFPCSVEADGTSRPNGCKGLPAALPVCQRRFFVSPTTDGYERTAYYTGRADRPTTKFSTNIVTTESLLVEGDIWVKGNILNAETGCLVIDSDETTDPPGGPGGSTCIECLGNGNVGITGSARIDGDLTVRGLTAIFLNTGGTFAVDSNFIKIGGLTGQNLPSADLNSNYSDRGLIIYNKPNGNGTSRSSFFGPLTATGFLTYIPDATITDNGSGRITVSGAPGRLDVATINGIGITHDTANNSGKITLRQATSTTAVLGGNILIDGRIGITSSAIGSAKSEIKFANTSTNALINVASNAAVIDFQRGYTFDSKLAGLSGSSPPTPWNSGFGSTNQATITVNNAGGNQETYIMPRYAAGNNIALVDVGRYTSGPANLNNFGSFTDANLQTLYNKALGDGCIIDCGTY